ncbi:MAG: hypothetical protein ACYS7Y_19125 [Planctomycetota bacterium]|jgi:hypothetical protein
MSETKPYAVLRTEGEPQYFYSDSRNAPDAIQKLIASHERPAGPSEDTAEAEEVVMEVVGDENGTVYDIFVNNLSVGYFACKAICAAHTGLKIATMHNIVQIGDQDDEDEQATVDAILEELDFNCFFTPLFGEV